MGAKCRLETDDADLDDFACHKIIDNLPYHFFTGLEEIEDHEERVEKLLHQLRKLCLQFTNRAVDR